MSAPAVSTTLASGGIAFASRTRMRTSSTERASSPGATIRGVRDPEVTVRGNRVASTGLRQRRAVAQVERDRRRTAWTMTVGAIRVQVRACAIIERTACVGGVCVRRWVGRHRRCQHADRIQRRDLIRRTPRLRIRVIAILLRGLETEREASSLRVALHALRFTREYPRLAAYVDRSAAAVFAWRRSLRRSTDTCIRPRHRLDDA